MKINGDMTLFELQAYCNGTDCADCEYKIVNSLGGLPFAFEFKCPFGPVSPREYPLYRRKTYKQDAREKFPDIKCNVRGVPSLCLVKLYGDNHQPDRCDSYSCEECWNRVMPEE